ncbi:MAG: RagB/SusD family nutrient uptake outer membrane protein, partial [Bacteroides sp.]|nr:RagB/SusD family nutrient uptake outer membrane protein [Bacteroides sp.]
YIIYFTKCILFVAGVQTLLSCRESFLNPDPLSFFEPGTTFTTPEGLQAALTSCDRQVLYYFYGEAAPFHTDLSFSEVAVSRITDKSTPAQNMDVSITPTSKNNNTDYNKVGWFWTEGFKGIRYANTVISNIDRVDGLDPDTHDRMLSVAYFHRAWHYYNLIFQFGDVPLLTREATGPKFDYHSTRMDVIIKKMIADLEYAVEYAPVTADYGNITQAACRHLLIKYYIADQQFDKAISEANTLIENSGFELIKEPFGTFINPVPSVYNVTRNVIWDLHRPENKAIPTNKEVLWVMTQNDALDNSRVETSSMRTSVPFWACTTGGRLILTPDGQAGMSASYDETKDEIDLRKAYGRGIAFFGGTWYSTHTIWSEDETDLRHSREHGNWRCMEDLVYNNPVLKQTNNPWYGKPLQLYDENGTLL